jgi:LPXTG-site transpeptidase (sortase) family protein
MGLPWKKIILALVIAAVVFFLLNADYFAKNIRHGLFRRYPKDPSQQISDVQPQAEPNTLWIESLDIKAPIIYTQATTEAGFQQDLQRGVVHYPETALPGELGNVYLFGHSSDLPWKEGDYKTVLALLPRIQVGAEIKVTSHEGKTFTYIVKETKVVGPKDIEVLSQFNRERKLLTVQTSYPIGTALRRFIVVAELK